MTTGPEGERRQEPTFVDVMNGFGLDSGRPVRRRLFGRLRGSGGTDPEARDVPRATMWGLVTLIFTWTRGRTKSGFDMAIETLVSTSARGRAQVATLPVEHRAVAELCEQTRSVAEVAALLSLPLGVARVLLGDMAGLGVVTVHQTASSAGSAPDLALMERVLSGLRRL